MRKPSFDRRLDEVGREEGERDRHVDLSNAAALSLRDGFHVCGWVSRKLLEPSASARVNGPRNLPSLGPAIFPTLAGLVISRLSDRYLRF